MVENASGKMKADLEHNLEALTAFICIVVLEVVLCVSLLC